MALAAGTPNFDHLAHIYRWMEMVTFGPWLLRCRCAFLGKLASRRNALVLGDGDGRFTARLLRENPVVLIDALDASFAMLMALVRNAGLNAGRVRVHQADARRWPPAGPPYDLIVTHFFLDCLTTDEVTTLATRLRPCVTPEALWVVSEFAVPPGPFGRLVALPVVSGLYLAFWLLTGLSVRRLPNHRVALAKAGFSLVRQRCWLGGLLLSQLWAPESSGEGRRNMPPIRLPGFTSNVTSVLISNLKELADLPFSTPDPSQ
jgi:SAM-dependent methyltransferase